MGLFGIFRSRDKPKNGTSGSAYPLLCGYSASGKRVNERTSMQMTAVYSCVRILSEAIASLPLQLYRYTEDGARKKRWITRFIFCSMMSLTRKWPRSFSGRQWWRTFSSGETAMRRTSPLSSWNTPSTRGCAGSSRLRMNRGSTYEDNVLPRDDISVIKPPFNISLKVILF